MNELSHEMYCLSNSETCSLTETASCQIHFDTQYHADCTTCQCNYEAIRSIPCRAWRWFAWERPAALLCSVE
jgi:hypothetical protein